jgi:hypothetical protein
MAFAWLFSTSIYVAWLFALTVLIGLGAMVAMRRREMMAFLCNHAGSCSALALAAFVVGAVPVLLIYRPTLHEQAGRPFRDYVSFVPFPKDLINVGNQNLAWSWLVDLSATSSTSARWR